MKAPELIAATTRRRQSTLFTRISLNRIERPVKPHSSAQPYCPPPSYPRQHSSSREPEGREGIRWTMTAERSESLIAIPRSSRRQGRHHCGGDGCQRCRQRPLPRDRTDRRALDRGHPVFPAPVRFVMQEGVDVGFGHIGVSGEIGFGREKWPGIPAFPASMNEVVERGVHSRCMNVRVRFEIMRRVEKS
jgi:hypothetical protein